MASIIGFFQPRSKRSGDGRAGRTKKSASSTFPSTIPGLGQEQFDAVAHGKEVFFSMGCIECHVTEKGDNSMKTGPNLYGLFLIQARSRKIGPAGERKSVKADKSYFTLRAIPES